MKDSIEMYGMEKNNGRKEEENLVSFTSGVCDPNLGVARAGSVYVLLLTSTILAVGTSKNLAFAGASIAFAHFNYSFVVQESLCIEKSVVSNR